MKHVSTKLYAQSVSTVDKLQLNSNCQMCINQHVEMKTQDEDKKGKQVNE